MSDLCLAIGASIVIIGSQPTISWMHSVEKIKWEEDYRAQGKLLELTHARVRGSGAGMEIPNNSKPVNDYWQYTPNINTFKKVYLTHSKYTETYTICQASICKSLSEYFPNINDYEVVELFVCEK